MSLSSSAIVAGSHGKVFLFVVIGGLLIIPTQLFLGQRQMIYFPRDYDPIYDRQLKSLTRVKYDSGGTRQSAFLLHEDSGEAPKKVWWCFGGNGNLAGDWFETLSLVDTPGTVFVLFDYPGYGYNGGKPGPRTISKSVDALQQLLSKRWGLNAEELSNRSAVLGHSLGCAAALDMASRHGIEEVVALSPFTTMKAMVKLSVGGLLSNLLLHRFDNESTLDQIVRQSPEASITIFHGEQDEIIPFRLGKELAGRHPGRVDFNPVAGAGHNDIITRLRARILEIISAP
ncbi:MAG: pimeloyl-ACP methyl ester carboxylesterase [Verrucomicrobiales bacterium]|jgi:pimeloyl-ACP methyl ester carboxylesterase